MLDIKFIRENPEVVKENIKKKFQEQKLPLVDEVIALDSENRAVMAEAQELRSSRNTLSKQVGMLMGQAKKDPSKLAEAEAAKAKVKANADRLSELEAKEGELAQKIRKIMLQIPNIIDPSVPIGPDDSCNVEVQRFGEPVVPDFEIPYHTQIMESFNGIDMDAAGRVSGNGFYYLMGDIARIHEGVLAYARDFMIGKGFIFCIPPFMIHGNVVEGVMSQTEMDAMMYKIEGEDLYLIGTSEHSMIGKFIDQIIPEDKLPQTLTSYSPCFRKEKGAHGIEERGVYRIHQFEKQEMVVVCKPDIDLPTAQLFARVRPESISRRPDTQGMLRAMSSGSLEAVARQLCNVFEEVLPAPAEAEVRTIKRQMMEQGALNAAMSGSGPTVFGLFSDSETARRAFEALQKDYRQTFLAQIL